MTEIDTDLLTDAQRLAPGCEFSDCTTDDQIIARTVGAIMGFHVIDGRSRDYIRGCYDSLAERSPRDPIRRAIMSRSH